MTYSKESVIFPMEVFNFTGKVAMGANRKRLALNGALVSAIDLAKVPSLTIEVVR